jgi:hypothetical protein
MTTDLGSYRVGLSSMISAVHASHHVDDDQLEPGISDSNQADQHVLDFVFMNITPQFNFYLSPNWDVGIEISMRMVDADAVFLGVDGEVLEDFSSIHHRNEVLFGPADIPLDVGWTLQSPLPAGHQLNLRLGATLPVGNTEPNPFALGLEGKAHQHIFFGTGTVNPTWSASYVLGLKEHQFFFFSEGRHALYRNQHDYQGPTTITSGGTFNYVINPSWQVRGTLITFKEWPAKWGDAIARNSGRLDAIPGFGVRWQSEDGLGIGLSSQFPININTSGGQMRMPWLLSLNVNFMGQFFQDDF